MNERQDEKIPSLTTVANFRDVSRYVKNIKPGLLFRSAHIDDASRDDLDTLRERCRIRSVIDLRGMQPWPLISTLQLPGKHDSDYTQQYPDHIASTSILGLRLHYISLAGPQYGRFVFSQLGYWERTKAIIHTAVSPTSGLQQWRKTVSSQLFQDRMAIPEAIIDHSFPQVKAIFRVLADPSAYPVLISNRYGSDFVSLVVDLVLFLLHADAQSIHRDYMQTYEDLASLKEERIRVNREQGVPEDFAEPFLPFVNSVEQHIQTKHGGIEQYLLGVGLGMSEIQTVRKTLASKSSVSEKQGWLVDI